MKRLLDLDDRDAMLRASQKIGYLIAMARSENPPTGRFLAESAHYAAELVDIAIRLDIELSRDARDDTEVA